MKEHKTQCKQAEHQRVFFWFGDDLAVDDNPHRAAGRRKTRGQIFVVTESSRKEVADGLLLMMPAPVQDEGVLEE